MERRTRGRGRGVLAALATVGALAAPGALAAQGTAALERAAGALEAGAMTLDARMAGSAARDIAREARALALRTGGLAAPVRGAVGPSRAVLDAMARVERQQDPADSVYRAAREALNGGRYARAAELFGQIRSRFPRSGYAADSYYFQALALYRAGGSQRNQQALALLDEQRSRSPGATSRSDADQLAVRIRAALAQTGDAGAAVAVETSAQEACDGQDQDLRATALSALLTMDAARAKPILMQVLQNRDACSAELRKRAVFLVAQKLDADAVDILLDLAERNPDPDPEVREQAVFWLSRVQTPEAVAALESILADSKDPDLQEKAVFALSRNGSPRAGEVLRSYAERADAPSAVREQAIFWLGRAPGGVAWLKQLYGRIQDPDLKEKVVFGVAQAGGDDAVSWLLERVRDASEPVDARKNALFWAERAGAPVSAILDVLRSVKDPDLREQAVFVLSREDDAAAVDALMDIARNDPDPELRKKAVFWLGRSKDPRATDFLMKLLQGGGVR